MESATEKKKKKQMMSLQSKIEKTDTGGIIYNTKRDWLSNENKYFQKKKKSESRSVVSTLWPVDCGQPGSFVHGIIQARILKRVAISFFRGSSQPRDQTLVPCIAGGLFTELPGGRLMDALCSI